MSKYIMSYFSTHLTDLKTSEEFTTSVCETEACQATEEYAARRAQMLEDRITARKEQICNDISTYFSGEFVSSVASTGLQLYVGDLQPADISDLQTILSSKGYTVTISEDGKSLTITHQ